jgi:hypothetical protein
VSDLLKKSFPILEGTSVGTAGIDLRFHKPCHAYSLLSNAMVISRTATDGREPYRVAARVFDTLLSDQIARSDSLNTTAGVFAGLGGVVTTLAGIVSGLDLKIVGKCGVAMAGLSVVLAVIALIVKRPGREPKELPALLRQILESADTTLTEDVLLETDAQAASRNDSRLRVKSVWVFAAATSLAVAIILLVVGML